MNDFDWDVLQKKRTASGARHLIRGSRSKKCTLPSDSLTASQRRRMNGEVETYNLSEAMGWKEYKKLPSDLKNEYNLAIVAKYDAGLNMAANDLFGVSNATLSTHLKNRGLSWPKTIHGCTKPSKQVMNAWYEFCGISVPENDDVEEPLNKPTDGSAETPVGMERNLAVAEMLSGELTLRGNAPDVASKLVTLLGVKDVWTIRFEFKKEP